MTLLYDDGTYTLDGEAVTQDELIVWRDAQIAAWAAELAALVVEELGAGETPEAAAEFGKGRITRFAGRFLVRVGEMITSAYVQAAGGVEAITAAGWERIAEMVSRQTEYGRGFIEALRNGELSADQAVARAQLYTGAAVEAFETGRMEQIGFDAPAQPGDGSTECLGNCRCYWEIVEVPGGVEATWVAQDDAGTCETCATRAQEWAPLVQEQL